MKKSGASAIVFCVFLAIGLLSACSSEPTDEIFRYVSNEPLTINLLAAPDGGMAYVKMSGYQVDMTSQAALTAMEEEPIKVKDCFASVFHLKTKDDLINSLDEIRAEIIEALSEAFDTHSIETIYFDQIVW